MYRRKGVGLPRQRPEGDRAGVGVDMALVCPDSPSPLWSCGPRGSGGGRRGRKEEPKALGFPQEEAGSSAPLLLPAQAPSSWSWAFPLLPRSPGLLSSALELSWSLGLLRTEGSELWRRRQGNEVARRAQQSIPVLVPERSVFSKQVSTEQLCNLNLVA